MASSSWYYNFIIIIYKSEKEFKKQFKTLSEEKSAIWIEHTKDLDDEGHKKKAHYHFILKLSNACTISALAKRIGVKDNMIEPIKKSFNGALKYLIHFGYDTKYQYDIEDVKSNSDKLLKKFKDVINVEEPEVDKVIAIQDYIESFTDYIDIGVLGRYVQKINKWDAFRRNMMYFIKLVDIHNGQINSKRYHSDEYAFYSAISMNHGGKD